MLQFNSRAGDVDGFRAFVAERAAELGPRLYSLQVTEEANFVHGPDVIAGPYPRVREALVEGVEAARAALDAAGLTGVPVGFSVTPTFGPNAEFWPALAAVATPVFHAALGYAGLDCFPDVFSPVSDVGSAMRGLLATMRTQWLPAAGIGANVPIHVCEWGWPTGPERSESRQAEIAEVVIRTVHDVRAESNVHRLTLFALRDADSGNAADIFCNFGFVRDDFTPKPAFDVCRRLLAELG